MRFPFLSHGWNLAVETLQRRAALILPILFAVSLPQFHSYADDADRVTAARKRCGVRLRNEFEKAGITWPADEILIRAMKRERVLELWAANSGRQKLALVKTYPFTAASGGPGPKRREGDRQVPEGLYEVDRFNPRSNFHLSLGLNYPNASDRRFADPKSPGSAIFIHGGAVSVGCIALGDAAIEELYLAALESRKRTIRVHIFPGRMDAPDWPAWRDGQLSADSSFRVLWDELAAEWRRFTQVGR